MSDETRLKERLRAIEALFSGATTPGERDAAGAARERIMARMTTLAAETPVEWQFTSLDAWNRRLLMALAKRYGLKTYRYRRQHRTTLMIKAPEPFLEEVFSPQFERMAETLREHLHAVAEPVIAEVIDTDSPAPPEPNQLSLLNEPKTSGDVS